MKLIELKKKALVNFLQEEYREEKDIAITQSEYNENLFETEYGDYLVLTDNEADKATEDNILDLLWAFNADFILDHSKLNNYNDNVLMAFIKMQEELCESANELVKAMIDDIDVFVQDAIDADGRGHFLSSYDGEENEVYVKEINKFFYVYRVN